MNDTLDEARDNKNTASEKIGVLIRQISTMADAVSKKFV